MTNGEKFIEVFGETTVLFDTDDNDTTIHQSGNWWDEEYKQSNSDEDCISRQAVLEIAKSSKSNWIDNSVLFKRVNELPPVVPKPKTDVLDKIKTEIETDLSHFCFDDWGNETNEWKEVKDIINKFKAESEDKE